MAHLQWLETDVRACCPLCGDLGPQGAMLATDHVLPGHPRITFLRCPACGIAFLQDLTPPDYGTGMMVVQLDYYVEQGAGIDCIVAPLLRLPRESVRRCLDVGCSFGFALDFCRWAFGWEVLGVDPSPLAAAGAAALDVPILPACFSSDLDLGPEPFDLVLCSEILEHLAEPLALLAALRERLSPEGLLVLSTPNLAIVRRDTDEGVLGRALSPGLHLMLYDRGALLRVLAQAGFSGVRIEESPETLRAFAACSPAALERMRPADPDRTLVRRYFGARAASSPPGSPLACGFAWRHFRECVNAGLHEQAVASREVLARIYRERFGLDLERPAELAARLDRPRPFNLAGALFFSGILELNGLRRPGRAAECFAAAVEVGSALLEEQRPMGICDGETESLTELSRKHLPVARAQTLARRIGRLFRRRPFSRRRPGRLLIAERFVAPCARLSSLILPLDVIARQPAERLLLAVIAADGASRAATLVHPRLSPDESLRLVFAPFDAPAGATFFLGVLDLAEGEAGLQEIRAAAGGRPPIALQCRGFEEGDLLPDERGIAVFRAVLRPEPPAAPAVRPEIRLAAGSGGERDAVESASGFRLEARGPASDLLMRRVSAILPVFNGRRFLLAAVRSVLAQSQPPCELIVVDDGSSDGSLAELERFLEELAPSPFPVRVLSQANAGQSAARNLAARQAEGEYLAFLDQDDQWLPQHLERLAAALDGDPTVGWAYCDFDEMDLDGNVVTRAFLSAQGVKHPKSSIFECVAADLLVLPSASVVRRAAFEQAGGFDETLSGYEDDDLFVRFFRLGWNHVFVDRTLLRFRIHSNSSSASSRFLASRLRYAEKLVAILPDDPRMLRYYVPDAIAPRFFFTSLDDYVRACSARDWQGARFALQSVNHFARLRRRGLRLRWKLLWIQHPRLFRWLVALNDRLPFRVRFVRNPTVTLR